MWEENDTNPHVFPHKLFSEAMLQNIFDCTVEVGFAYCGLNFRVIEYMITRSCTRSITRQGRQRYTSPTSPSVVISQRRRWHYGVASLKGG